MEKGNLKRFALFMLIFTVLFVTCILRGRYGAREKNSGIRKDMGDINSEEDNTSPVTDNYNSVMNTDENGVGEEHIPENTKGEIKLNEEFIHSGIGCTVGRVVVTDADNDFAERFPEYADKAKWNCGCISSLDWANYNIKAGLGYTEFVVRPAFKIIMEITFHNYKEIEDYSLFYQDNYLMRGVFVQNKLEIGGFEFLCQYNSEHYGSSDQQGIHHFRIAAGSDYKAVFIFTAHPFTASFADGSSEGYMHEFTGDGDLYLIPSQFISRWGAGDENVPHIYIPEESIEKDICHVYEDEDYKERKMTYQEYVDLYH